MRDSILQIMLAWKDGTLGSEGKRELNSSLVKSEAEGKTNGINMIRFGHV
jgi:hypothetical protein